jgi:hypothetical protein
METDDITKLPFVKLQLIDHDVYKWSCCIEGCEHFTRIADFGESPLFYHRKKWNDLSKLVWYCGKHWSIFKKSPLGKFPFKIKEKPLGIDNIHFEKSISLMGKSANKLN